MDCNTITYITAILGAALAVSELLPHVSLTQCNSIMEILLLICKKQKCGNNPVIEATHEATNELSAMVQTLKDEIIIDLRNELAQFKEVRKSLDVRSSLDNTKNLCQSINEL
jgi:hypothetical protein